MHWRLWDLQMKRAQLSTISGQRVELRRSRSIADIARTLRVFRKTARTSASRSDFSLYTPPTLTEDSNPAGEKSSSPSPKRRSLRFQPFARPCIVIDAIQHRKA